MNGQPTGFWGKLEQDKRTGVVRAWHPLIDHCADVAACAEALLTRTLLGRRLARLGGLTELDSTQIARLCVLVALHDYGKFNLGFQRKWIRDLRKAATDVRVCARCGWAESGRGPLCLCAQASTLAPAGGICTRCARPGAQAGQACPTGDGGRIVDLVITGGHVSEGLALFHMVEATMQRFAAAMEAETLMSWCNNEDHLLPLLSASVAHHGRPISADDVKKIDGVAPFWQAEPGRDPIAGIASLLAAARTWFPAAFAPGGRPLPGLRPFIHGFNGFVSLADWLGSDTLFFPYSEPEAPPRMAFARARAALAIDRVGLDAAAARVGLGKEPVAFRQLGIRQPPRNVQATMEGLPTGEQGSLTILEAPTGEGKTEAAMWRYLRLFQAGDVDGLYFALPTRTAAQEIYNRINEMRKAAFGEKTSQPVIQAVPGYFRVDDTQGHQPSQEEAKARALPPFTVLWDDLEVPGRGWAAENSKRYLAGALVVGTIDQVLLAGLQAKHAHLRAAGLLRLLLVVDEVHASDVYMTAILKGVLQRHRDAGGHALLLSATLGGEARADYLGEKGSPTQEEAEKAPYPRVWHLNQPPQDPLSTQHKDVHWCTSPLADDPLAIAARAVAAAQAGARVLIVRNTVAQAIEVQKALENHGGMPFLLRVGNVPAPHHGRFAQADRKRLDNAIQALLGKKGSPDRGAIAVGTQTVEQSLDLDADLLITDLCPIDVLLQRLGRVHRHDERTPHRPAGFEQAQVEVLVSADKALVEHITHPKRDVRGPHGIGTVYRDLRVLEATRRLIVAHPHVVTPRDCRWLVEGGLHSEVKARLDAEDGRFASHGQQVAGAALGDGIAASLVIADWQAPFKETRVEGLDAKITTRLGLSDLEVVFPKSLPGPFGETFNEIKISGRLLPEGLTGDFKPSEIEVGDSTVRFTVAGVSFTYDSYGLARDPK